MHIHTRSINHRIFDAWRNPGRFTKNPDIICLPSGRLLLVYSDNDAHWSQESQILTILASDDGGESWFKLSEVDSADLRMGDERLVTPRLSILGDGRLAVLIDHDDFGHFHEDQPCGNWVYWSKDGGKTWDGPYVTGIKGFEPDRMMELPDGKLAIVTHWMRGESQEFAVILSCSEDGGSTWHKVSTIAHDGYHRFCEGALVILNGGKELACIMRENHSAGIPSFVCFSRDYGLTWTVPQMLPFAFHRPYAKQLGDGQVLVTGRNVNGGLGTYAWYGDLKAEAGYYAVGGPRKEYCAELSNEALIIENKPGYDCRYTLLPSESSKSEIVFEALMKVEGEGSEPVAFMSLCKLKSFGGTVLKIAPGWIVLGNKGADFHKKVDMTQYRRIKIHNKGGLLQVSVDGKVLINQCVFREEVPLADFYSEGIDKRTQFGQLGNKGKSYWKKVSYKVHNFTQPDFQWIWNAKSWEWPDQYQRDRLIQIHANTPDRADEGWPDNGYSSWVLLEDGRIMLVDYTNLGDEFRKSHIVGVHIKMEDIV